MPSRQSASVRCLSSSAILACAHTSSTDLSAWAAAISTPRSGAHCLQRPFFSFQHCSRHIQALQRGTLYELGQDLFAAPS